MGHEPTVCSGSLKPDWACRILALRQRLHLSQTTFGQMVDSSAMGVSRWERGVQEPPSHGYIGIGNIAGDPHCWYFWGRAGLRTEDVIGVLPEMQRRLRKAHTPGVEIVTAGSGNKRVPDKVKLVAIPVLKTVAAPLGEKGDDISYLPDAGVESMIAAPKRWCPHPSSTSCLRV